MYNININYKIIYINFIHLQNQPDINFTIDDIVQTVNSLNQLGWFLINSLANSEAYLKLEAYLMFIFLFFKCYYSSFIFTSCKIPAKLILFKSLLTKSISPSNL